jgi:Sugar (pentulose and hexulose) kinases
MRSSSATSGSRHNEIVSAQFLAFDLGAESGRAMLGTLNGGVLSVREIHRFLNEPVRQNGSLQWDILHLWQEMRRALELNGRTRLDSVGVDSWGVTTASWTRPARPSRSPPAIGTPSEPRPWPRSWTAYPAT